jgi:hypothetical protein
MLRQQLSNTGVWDKSPLTSTPTARESKQHRWKPLKYSSFCSEELSHHDPVLQAPLGPLCETLPDVSYTKRAKDRCVTSNAVQVGRLK